MFYDIKGRLINLDHVVEIRRIWSKNPKGCMTVLYMDGDQPNIEINDYSTDIEDLLSVVIPAAPGLELFQYWFWDEEPTEAHISSPLNRIPIVAWRVLGQTASPVIPDDCSSPPNGSGVQVICYPNGAFCDPYAASYQDAAALLEMIRSEWSEWKRKQTEAAHGSDK